MECRLKPLRQASRFSQKASKMRHNSGIGNVTEWPKVLPC